MSLQRSYTSQGDFNPRAPRGARLAVTLPPWADSVISIHVPREGHDGNRTPPAAEAEEFQSTCPARGTTYLTR